MFSSIRSGRTTRPVDQSPEPDQHVVEQRRRAGQHDPLHGRVADVPFVPQRLVLQAREREAAQQARQAGQTLGQDRVALVGHRAGTLLAVPERLLELRDLGVLEVAHLGREPFDGAAGDRDRGQERRVPVALHDLGADRVDGPGRAPRAPPPPRPVRAGSRCRRGRRSCPWPGRRSRGAVASGHGRARTPTTRA